MKLESDFNTYLSNWTFYLNLLEYYATFGSEITKFENVFTKVLLIFEFKGFNASQYFSSEMIPTTNLLNLLDLKLLEDSVIIRNLGIWELIWEQYVLKLSKRLFFYFGREYKTIFKF